MVLMKENPSFNKKVLLRERKRHTARRVASTRYAVLVGVGVPTLGGGYLPWWGGGVPTPGGGWGTYLGRYPHPDLSRYPPPIQT